MGIKINCFYSTTTGAARGRAGLVGSTLRPTTAKYLLDRATIAK